MDSISRNTINNINTNNTGSVTYKLEYPIQHGSKVIDELTIMRPKFYHFKKVDKVNGDMAKTNEMFIHTCRDTDGNFITPSIADQIDGVDIQRISKIFEEFAKESRET